MRGYGIATLKCGKRNHNYRGAEEKQCHAAPPLHNGADLNLGSDIENGPL